MTSEKDDEIDYYEILGLSFSTTSPPTSSQIKKAYRNQAKVLHPDKNKDLDAAKAAEKFHILNTAYETLLDDDKRKEFDTKCSAKLKRKRQLAEMDEEMRKKRGELEERERAAKRRKGEGGLGEVVGKWRKESIRLENLEIRKMMEEEEMGRLKARRSEELNGGSKTTLADNRAILRVSWEKRFGEYGRRYTSQDLTTLFSRWGTVGSAVVAGETMKGIVEIVNPNIEALEALVKKSAASGPFVLRWKKKPEIRGAGNGGRVSKEVHDSLEASILKRMSSSSQAARNGGGGGGMEASILKKMSSTPSVGGGGGGSSEESILKKMSSTSSVAGGGSFEESILKKMSSSSSVGGKKEE